MQEQTKNQENAEETNNMLEGMAGGDEESYYGNSYEESMDEMAAMDEGIIENGDDPFFSDEVLNESEYQSTYIEDEPVENDGDEAFADEDIDLDEDIPYMDEDAIKDDESGVYGDEESEEDMVKASFAVSPITQLIDKREKLVTILFWLFALSGVVISFQNGGRSNVDIAGCVVVNVLCLMLYTFFVDISEFNGESLFFLFCSGIFLGLSSAFNAPLFWIVFAVVAAVVEGMRLGMASFLLLFIEYLICIPSAEVDKNRIIAVFLMGMAFVCLFSYIKEKENRMEGKALIMMGVIILCQSLVLYFVGAHFSLKEVAASGSDLFMWLFGALFLYVVGIIVWFVHNNRQKCSISEDIISPDYELCSRMREYSEPLYRHSMRVSNLGRGACDELGGDALLVQAAGLYHEIGRIRDEDVYIEEGLELCKAYHFPERLLEVISQHSTAFEKPRSVEAAVLMLTDCIVSTNEYLEKTGKRSGITDDKLVSIIFQNRVDKGNLSESGITNEQLDVLKQYYTKHMKDIRNSF